MTQSIEIYIKPSNSFSHLNLSKVAIIVKINESIQNRAVKTCSVFIPEKQVNSFPTSVSGVVFYLRQNANVLAYKVKAIGIANILA